MRNSFINDILDESSQKEIKKYNFSDDECSVENLWLERNILLTGLMEHDDSYISKFNEIKKVLKLNLNPVHNAMNDINEKTKELKQFIMKFNVNINSLLNERKQNKF